LLIKEKTQNNALSMKIRTAKLSTADFSAFMWMQEINVDTQKVNLDTPKNRQLPFFPKFDVFQS